MIHIQTNISTILGILDDEGNVVKKQPVSVEVAKLDRESFLQALQAILNAKQQLESQ